MLEQTGCFNLGMATSQGEGKLKIQTSCRSGEGWSPPCYSHPRPKATRPVRMIERDRWGIFHWRQICLVELNTTYLHMN